MTMQQGVSENCACLRVQIRPLNVDVLLMLPIYINSVMSSVDQMTQEAFAKNWAELGKKQMPF
jgi:hypothetical protein